MKKFFFMAAAATALFAACNKTEVVYTDGPQEIAMFAVSNTATKAPVPGTDFPTTDKMEVAAYIASGTPGNFFGKTTFAKPGAGTYWVGGQYWPVNDATINFLAVSEPESSSPITSIDFNATNYASGATVVLGDNSEAQYDLMYAAGQGKKVGNSASDVDMSFRHALSWICFTVGKSETTTAEVKVTSITLNDAYYGGTYTITNNNYSQTETYASSADGIVSGVWSSPTNKKNKTITETVTCSTTSAPYGDGLLVVPGEATNFTITYTIGDSGALTYNHTIVNPATPGWAQAYKYIYNVNFGLNQIEIDPVVITWKNGAGDTVTL